VSTADLNDPQEFLKRMESGEFDGMVVDTLNRLSQEQLEELSRLIQQRLLKSKAEGA